MYQIMIVDDETIVREGIKDSIEWNKHGFELMGDYVNGREALDAIELYQPDLVLSDICMPIMDGLELTKEIQTRYPYIKVIILTGYDDFNYAQQALRLKASDFIIKPITAMELRGLLDKLKLKLDEERKEREDISRLQTQLNESFPLLKERFLERMVTSGLSAVKLKERFQYFQLPWISPGHLVMVLDIDDFGEGKQPASEHDAELFSFAGYNIVKEIISREQGLVFRVREERMVVILSGLSEELLYELAYRLAGEIMHYIDKYLKFTVTVGVGSVCNALEELPLSFSSAVSAIDYRFLLGKNRVISIIEIEGKRTIIPIQNIDWNRKLNSMIKTGTTEDVNNLISKLIISLKTSLMPIEACYLQIQKIVVSLLNTVQELGMNEWTIFADDQNPLTDIYRFKTLDEIEIWLNDLCEKAIVNVSEKRNDLTKMQVLRAIDYIHEHYSEEKVTLQELCRHVLMSISYFSRVFKQHTGETFVEYLTRVRVEKAKVMLLHTSLRTYEIADQVGYNDPNYFSILFKKHTGMTPTDYRESIMKG